MQIPQLVDISSAFESTGRFQREGDWDGLGIEFEMGTSKHKRELLSLTFYCYLSIPAVFARLYKVYQEERTCKLARGFKNQDQELYPGKSRLQRKARHAGQMAWILQAPKGSKRNQSHVLRRMKDYAEVQGAWRTMAQNSSGCAVHVDTL